MEVCCRVLQQIVDAHGTVRRTDRFNSLVSKVYREARRRDLQAEQSRKRTDDRALQAQTAMVQTQRDTPAPPLLPPAPQGPPDAPRHLHTPEACYVCKEDYTEVHHFYHLLCPRCAAINYEMRHLHADLTGRTALVTGGRVKIGYHLVLRLLRDGARVMVTTRFPHAAAARFHAEADSSEWAGRLELHGLDLRNIPVVEAFARHLDETLPSLDIVIHNAAQTIRRPHGFYTALMAQEAHPDATLPRAARQMVRSVAPSTIAAGSASLLPAFGPGDGRDILPIDTLHDNEERADSRTVNSWLLRLDAVGAGEMLEVQLVNSVAPFVLNSLLKPVLMRSPQERRFIVNVSAMEGQFSRHKTVYHPHTNMAKAALNMMTRTSGDDYARDRIYMTSVDTGWITDENPAPRRQRNQEELGFFAPLDAIDGMARIYHPVAAGINDPQTPFFGVFLKDYAPCLW